MGSFCLKKEGKRRKGWWSRGQVQGWGPGLQLSLTAAVVITSQREKWKTWEAGLGRHGGWMFNSYFPSSAEFFSPYFPKKYNDFDLVPLRKFKTKLLFRLASGANKRSHTHVNRGRPRILKQTLRSAFPEASKETAVVPRKTNQSFLTGSKDGGVVKTACMSLGCSFLATCGFGTWHSNEKIPPKNRKTSRKMCLRLQPACLQPRSVDASSLFQVISFTDCSSVLLQWSRWSEV